LLVEPEGLETDPGAMQSRSSEVDDPLLNLFSGEPLTVEAFHDALRQQRATPQAIASSAAAGASS